MMKFQLVYPMTLYVIFIFLTAANSFRVRVGAVKRREIHPGQFKTYQGEMPDHVIVAGRHYDNQFQVPLLFLVACCAHMIVGMVNPVTMWFAWVFVVSRLVHSFVHLGSNSIMPRIRAFVVGWIAVIALFVQLALFVAQLPS